MSRDRIRLTYDVVTIDVEAGERAMLVWLTEFLGSAFERVPVDGEAPDHLVRFEAAPLEHTRRRSELASAPLELGGFTFDGSFSRHRGWAGDDGRTWIHDERRDTFYGVDDHARSVLVVADREGPRQRIGLMRVVRELATGAMHRSARLPVHGAAFLHHGEAVLACGPKRSGKTSLLVHALRCGCDFISNDRVFVATHGPATARAMPTIVMLRDGTLDLFDGLKEAFESARFDRARTIAECGPGIARPEPSAPEGFDRPGITPAQLCRLLGASMRRDAPIGMILFPRIDPDADGLVLEPLEAARAREAMEASLLKPSHPTRYSEVFAPDARGEEVAPEVEAGACRRLVDRVPAYGCRLGANAFQVDLGAALCRARTRWSDRWKGTAS